MKISRRLLLASFALALTCIPLYSQDTTPAPKPSASPLAITPEQRAKLKAAYETAMQDPKVLAARGVAKEASDNFRAAAKKVSLANDPTLQPIFDKIDKAVKDNTPGGILAVVTPDERAKLHDAFQKSSADPEVKQLMAKSEEAAKTVNANMRAAILQADSSLGPVLDVIDAATKNAPHPTSSNPTP